LRACWAGRRVLAQAAAAVAGAASSGGGIYCQYRLCVDRANNPSRSSGDAIAVGLAAIRLEGGTRRWTYRRDPGGWGVGVLTLFARAGWGCGVVTVALLDGGRSDPERG